MAIKSFTSFINEAVSKQDMFLVARLIKTFIGKKLGTELHLYPEPEEFMISGERLIGIRYFYGKQNSVRFNWVGKSIDQTALHSITIWKSKEEKYQVSFDHDVSLVKILPQIVGILKNPKPQEFTFIPDDGINESELNESQLDPATIVHQFLSKFNVGDQIVMSKIIDITPKNKTSYRLLKQVVKDNPKVFDFSGKSPIMIGSITGINLSTSIGNTGGAHVTVAKSTAQEVDIQKGSTATVEEEVERIAYKKQLEHMRGFVRLIKSKATNLLILTGKGGTGKTYSIEAEMQKAGLTDGDGYFKTVGAGSSSATYETLYKNRDKIIMFDECDTLMNDPEVRNMIKAATDSGKTRKISFNKKSANYYDPATEAEPEEDDGRLPRYFDFSGGIILIANVQLNKLDPDGAIRTRGFTMEINPTREEMLEVIGVLLDTISLPTSYPISSEERTKVYNWMIENGGRKSDLNIRSMRNALCVYSSFEGDDGWQEMIKNYGK